MAKLWEVLKAFDEGESIKAERTVKGRQVELLFNGKQQGVTMFFDKIRTELKNSDFDSDGWEIVENPAAKTNDYLMVVCKIIDDSQNSWSEHEIFQHCSLDKALEKMKHEFRDNQVYLLSAVASNHNGVVTVLAYEGGMVE